MRFEIGMNAGGRTSDSQPAAGSSSAMIAGSTSLA